MSVKDNTFIWNQSSEELACIPINKDLTVKKLHNILEKYKDEPNTHFHFDTGDKEWQFQWIRIKKSWTEEEIKENKKRLLQEEMDELNK